MNYILAAVGGMCFGQFCGIDYLASKHLGYIRSPGSSICSFSTHPKSCTKLSNSAGWGDLTDLIDQFWVIHFILEVQI